MYRLGTENFMLELDPKIYQEDIGLPINTLLSVKVNSYGFAGACEMDIDARKLAVFSMQLKEMQETLKGTVKLEEPYGEHNYIEFITAERGHIKVRGYLSENAYGDEHELTFENEFDQTYLKPFAQALSGDLEKYL